MNFLNPQYLLLLIFIPIYIGVFLIWKKRAGFGISVFSDLVIARKKGRSRFIPILRHVLIILLIVFFAITLARPQSTHQTQDISKNGIDIVVALDVSDSMRAEDLLPNRIEAAKKVLMEFVDTRESDRVGIVVFSGAPFTQSPLTFDYSILRYYVENISTETINQRSGLGGTAIGDAILASLNRIKEDDNRTKIIVLISDGDANVGVDPVVAAYKAKEKGVKIYTIGIGKKGGAPIPVSDILGQKSYARNRDGSVYMATFNEDALRKIASVTKGQFFRVEDNKSFSRVLHEIDSLEKRDVFVVKQLHYSDAFVPFLVTLSVLFFLYILLELIYGIKQ